MERAFEITGFSHYIKFFKIKLKIYHPNISTLKIKAKLKLKLK